MHITRYFALCALLIVMAPTGGYAGPYKHHKAPTGRATLADPGELNYDVKHLEFHLNMTDTSVYVSGNVTTTAQVTAGRMGSYVFELDTLMVIDSVIFNGMNVTFTSSGATIRTVTLPVALAAGTMFTAQVYYHGVPPSGSGFFNGLTYAVSSGGTKMVYSVSDPYAASDWWPSKQDIDDKIDSVDMYVTVPNGVKDGSNGLLVNVDSLSDPGYTTYHWQTHYMIDYYLISISIARYAEYRSYVTFPGSTDSMLIQNFFVDTATFNPMYKANFDSIGQIIQYYSTLYGRYPFWKEKYGVCYTTLPGGMEHQTMTTIGVPETYIIAHELCHQWFGDHVTYETWGDIWLSEGFATFSEQIFLNHFWGAAAAKAHRQTYLSVALGDPCGELYATDTSTAASIFNEQTTYAKGQGVVTMLRYLAPTDSMFFQMLRNYQSDHGLGWASTADLKMEAEAVYGFNLDTFFNQWVYGKGFPIYLVSWNQVGSSVYVQLVQKQSCAGSPAFSTPLEIELESAAGDTIIKVYNDADTTLYSFNWSPTMTGLLFNPDIWTICKQQGVVAHNGDLKTTNVLPRSIKVLDNPSKNYWEIDELPAGTLLLLSDMSGRTMWQGKSIPGPTYIPGASLAAGEYLLKMSNNGDTQSIRLLHW